jgi:predicted phosphate transport protein (TIGR00153 family)
LHQRADRRVALAAGLAITARLIPRNAEKTVCENLAWRRPRARFSCAILRRRASMRSPMIECAPSSTNNEASAMFSRLMPQEGKFFELFNSHAEQIVLGCEALNTLLEVLNGSDEEALRQCELIDTIEHTGDTITHETMRQLHKSFITPLDRDEIHQLITSLDDILDLIQDVAHTVTLYDIHRVTPAARELGEICRSCCKRVGAAVALLPSMDNGPEILKICHEIDQLESEADRVMRGAMSLLFREEPDVRELIKFKAIYELLEIVTDRCEDVANIIEGIVLENS